MSTDRPLVSAVMIFLDGEPFLAEAIDSVLAQTYPDLELLLVDDGSSDGSPAIARRYSQQQSGRVRVLEHAGHQNRGMSASRNLGVAHARGDYIAFLDADDVWLPEKIAEQLGILVGHPEVALLYGRTQIWNSWQPGNLEKDFFYPLGVDTEQVHSPPRMLAGLVENRFQTPTTCNAIIRRDAYLQLGGFEDSFRGLYEDQAFFAKLYLEYPTYVSSRFWARYRQHGGNSTGAAHSDLEYYRGRRMLMEFIRQRCQPHWSSLDSSTRAMVTRELWRARHPRLAALRVAARKRWRRLFRR